MLENVATPFDVLTGEVPDKVPEVSREREICIGPFELAIVVPVLS